MRVHTCLCVRVCVIKRERVCVCDCVWLCVWGVLTDVPLRNACMALCMIVSVCSRLRALARQMHFVLFVSSWENSEEYKKKDFYAHHQQRQIRREEQKRHGLNN